MFKYTSYINSIEKEMERAARRQRGKAALHLKKKLKEETTSRFGSGSNITKGMAHRNDKDQSLVGAGKPAYAAHLVEFGTDSRFTKKGKSTGHIKADPFMFPLFEREAGAVINILQETWF